MTPALLTAGQVRDLLHRHGIAPRKAHGQNFVVDPNTVRKVVRDAGIAATDTVCEIGPGLGSLTLALRETGARVVAVEVDSGMVRALGEVLAGDEAVRIVHADAMGVDFSRLVEPGAVLVANLPYNIATGLVMRALAAAVFDRLLVMVQKEVGRRWVAGVGDPEYSGVSVKIAALAQAQVVAAVSRRAFYPVPGVDSVTVRLTPRPWSWPVERERLFSLIEQGFAQRRKRLRNALSAGGHAPAAVEQALVAIGRDPGSRAEELGVEAWIDLAGALA